jgi:hypothetical protein
LSVETSIQPEASGDQTLNPAPAADRAETQLWVVPWISLVVLVALIATAVLLWIRRRRNAATARRNAPSPTLPDGGAAGSPVDGPGEAEAKAGELPVRAGEK